MNWLRIVLDGLAMALVFNAVVGMFWFLMPHAYARMLPKEIKEAAGPQTKTEIAHLAAVLYPLYIGVIAWMVASAYSAGVTGFWNLFWTGYCEMMFVNLGDFLILDCWLRAAVKDKGLIAGAEHCKAWEWKEWRKQAVPEHFVLGPLVFCPVVGLICAGIGTLIR